MFYAVNDLKYALNHSNVLRDGIDKKTPLGFRVYSDHYNIRHVWSYFKIVVTINKRRNCDN